MNTLFTLMLCYGIIFRGTSASVRRGLMMKRTMWRDPHQAWFSNPQMKSQPKQHSTKEKGQVWWAKSNIPKGKKRKGKGSWSYQWMKSKSSMAKSSEMKNMYKGKGYQQMKQYYKGNGKGKGGTPSGCIPLHQTTTVSVQENGLQSSGYFFHRKSPALEFPPLLSPHSTPKKPPPSKGYDAPATAPVSLLLHL